MHSYESQLILRLLKQLSFKISTVRMHNKFMIIISFEEIMQTQNYNLKFRLKLF